jgi:hypothetical protein
MNFLKKYDDKKNIRFPSFEFALIEANKRGLKNIVETGTARGKVKFFFFKKYNWKDGMSTIMFVEYAKYVDGMLHTCDISAKNIENAKDFTKEFSKNITYHIDDSVNFLKNFNNKIDLLYLDSLDGHNTEKASLHQLNEIKVSIDKLHSKSIVLLDDKGSKTNLSLKFLTQNKFKILFETNFQILLAYE